MKDRFKTFHEGEMPEGESRMEFAEHSEPNDSLLETYEFNLNISLADLKGKKVLDIGGMMDGEFSMEANKIGIDLTIADPINPYGTRGGKNVKAIMQELPFKDNTFDIELSHGAAPFLPNYESEYRTAFNEIIRTLKPQGTAIVFPIMQPVKDSEVFQTIVQDLEKVSSVNLEEVVSETWEKEVDEDGKILRFFRLTLIKK